MMSFEVAMLNGVPRLIRPSWLATSQLFGSGERLAAVARSKAPPITVIGFHAAALLLVPLDRAVAQAEGEGRVG